MNQNASPYTPAEVAFRERIREVANSGNLHAAMTLAREFHKEHPTSYVARYYYAVESGDYACEAEISEDEKKALKEEAIRELKALHNDPELPENWKYSVANEVFWFTQQHVEQYNLGIERVQSGNLGGHYSACVGASDQAKKLLFSDRDLALARAWAQKSVEAFGEYEKHNPTWSNINPFAATAVAILGDTAEALRIYTDMFRKQGNAPDQKKIDHFRSEIASIVQAQANCM